MINIQKWLEEQKEYDTKEKRAQIKELKIKNEELEGSLDLRGFTSLQKLDIQFSWGITGCNISGISDLTSIFVCQTQITELDFSASKEKITELYLNDCNFPQQDLGIFRNLSNLEILSISNLFRKGQKFDQWPNMMNKFEGSLETLRVLEKLKTLCIDNTDIDSGLEYLSESVTSISVEINQPLDVNFNPQVVKIKEQLALCNNNLKIWREWNKKGLNGQKIKWLKEAGIRIDDYNFADFLSKKKCEILTADKEVLETKYEEYHQAQTWLDFNYPKKNRNEVKKLDVRNKELRGNLDLTEFINLIELDCSNNQLEGLSLSSSNELKKVNCNDNLLTNFDYSFLGADKLITLQVKNNNLNHDDPHDLSEFSKFTNLETLWIGNDNHEKIKEGKYNHFFGSLEILKDLTKLNILHVSNTDIEGGIEYLPNSLTEIYYSAKERPESKLKGIEKQLEELSDNLFTKNKLNRMYSDKSVKVIDNLYSERLKGHLDLSEYENLEVLDCHNNQLTSIDLNKNTKLKKINCSNNFLKDTSFLYSTVSFFYPLSNPEGLIYLNISNNNFSEQDLSFLKNFINLEELYLGNTSEEKIKKGKCNKFIGSLEKLSGLKNLKTLDISNTDISDGVKDLPKNLIKVPFSKEILRGDGVTFKVNHIKRLIENRFNVTKVANLPTFFQRQWEEAEYYNPNSSKWGLKEKVEEKREAIYKTIYPNKTLKSDAERHKTKVDDLPTKLLKIPILLKEEVEIVPKEVVLEVIEVKRKNEKGEFEVTSIIEKNSSYAVLSYNWGREREEQKEKEEKERLERRLKGTKEWEELKNQAEELENKLKKKLEESERWKKLDDKNKSIEDKIIFKENYSSFFFTEEQYEKYKLKNFNGKEITKDEIEQKSPAFAKTLLKAVEACRLLGIEYLWMDQLCVDQHNNIEKNHEVNQMSKYYGNSAVTLVAIHKNLSEKKVDKLDPVLAIEKVINSEWFQRSWCFQEGWLSKRTLFMFDDMLIDGSYLAQVWAYNQATDVEGKYSGRQEFEDQEVKIATPIGWARYKEGYKSEEKLTFRLHEALRGIKDRKRAFPIDGIYSILGLLPYQVEPNYQDEYPEGYLQEELSRVMKVATDKGYLEHLSWHGPGNNWIPDISDKGSTEIWGGINIHCREGFVNVENGSISLVKSKKYPVESTIKNITKIGGDSVIGGVYSGTVKLKGKGDIKLWGTEVTLESVQEDDFLIIPDISELQSDTPFGILVREEKYIEERDKFDNRSIENKKASTNNEEKHYYRVGLIEIKKEDKEKLENNEKKLSEEIIINLNMQLEQSKKMNESEKKEKKRVFLGGTCSNSTWREKLIPLLDEEKISYFNPVVPDWTPEDQEREMWERKACDYLLYVVTKEMEGFYSITEVVEDSIKRPKKTIFCYLEKGFTKHQIKSLKATERLVRENGARVFSSLEDVAKYLNGGKLKEVDQQKQVNNGQEFQVQIQIPPKSN